MPAVRRADASGANPTAQQEIARLAELPEVRRAALGFRSGEAHYVQWQLEMARIAAPPFGENARAEWLAQRFQELGLEEVHTDDVGNVFGILGGSAEQFVALSAHL